MPGLNTLILAIALALPLQDPYRWQVLEYNHLPPNQVEFRVSARPRSEAGETIKYGIGKYGIGKYGIGAA